MRNNLHVTSTPFLAESRLLRETRSLLRHGVVDRVHIAALHERDLPEHEELDDARVVWRVRLTSRSWPRLLPMQIAKLVEFSWRVVRYARHAHVDVVNVHRLDLLPLGVLIKVACRARLVFDAHELETEIAGLAGVRKLVAKAMERLLIRWSDLVIVVSPSIRDWYAARFPRIPIVAVLNSPEYREPRRTSKLRTALGVPADTKLLLYQGGLVRGRGIERLIESFEAMQDDRYALAFLGYGALEPLVRAAAARSQRIYFHAAVPPHELLEYTGGADVGVALTEDTCLSHRYSLPNKLFEYLMAGVPVIVSDLPEMRRVVQTFGVGVVLPAMHPASLAAALAELESNNGAAMATRLAAGARAHAWEAQERVMIDAYRAHVTGAEEMGAS